jgi:hypothetical protein
MFFIWLAIFWFVLIGEGWKKSEGSINYQYIAGGVPPTKQDVASRSVGFPVCIRLTSTLSCDSLFSNDRNISMYPLCLSPRGEDDSSDTPPVWYYQNTVRNPPMGNRTFNHDQFRSSSLYLQWDSSTSAWLLAENFYPLFKQPTEYLPNASSVPSGSGWLRAHTHQTSGSSIANSYETKFESDTHFSIQPCAFNSSVVEYTSEEIPECYNYVVTQYPIDITNWPGLFLLLMGIYMLCFLICHDTELDEKPTFLALTTSDEMDSPKRDMITKSCGTVSTCMDSGIKMGVVRGQIDNTTELT